MGLYRYIGHHGEGEVPDIEMDGKPVRRGDLVRGDYDGDNRFMAVADPESVEPAPKPAKAPADPFDHDDNGKPGGSLPGRRKGK